MNADDIDPCWVIARLARAIENSLLGFDLSLPQYRVLTVLAGNSEGAAALAAKLAVKPASVTSVVDGLVARGLVERRGDGDDRRKVTHVVSASGIDVLAQARTVAVAGLRDIAGHLDPDNASAAWAAFDAWNQALVAYRASRLAKQAS
jgi:DNA-binding MarR family transcriptional regulator